MAAVRYRTRLRVHGIAFGAACAAGLSLAVAAEAAESPLWTRTFGTALDDGGIGIAADGKGSVYAAGTARSVECGGDCPDPEGWLAKLDAAGAVKWRRQIADSITWARDVATDGAGAVYVTGWTFGALGGPNLGASDVWLAKYDAGGNRQWTTQFGTAETDQAYGVATDRAGNVYTTGLTRGPLGGPLRGDVDAWVAKHDANGSVLWKRQIGSVDAASAVATDATGNVYVAGSSGRDAFVAKLNTAGRTMWIRRLPAGDGTRDGTGVATDPSGNVFVSGSIRPQSADERDGVIAKLTSTGTVLWQQQLGTPEDDRAVGAGIDGSGNVYVAGYTNGSLGGPAVGEQNGWVAKYDPAGGQRWVRQFGRDLSDEFWEVASDRAGSLYVTGWTYDTNRGNFDAWVVKYSASR